MIAVGVLALWTVCAGAVVAGAWRRMQRSIKVYLLILASCLYLCGVFVLYALVHGLPM